MLELSPELKAKIGEIMDLQHLPQWLETPLPWLGGRAPAEIIAAGEDYLIMEEIESMQRECQGS